MLQRDLREQIGFEILEKGIVKSQKEAAEAVDIPYSTLNHRKVSRLWDQTHIRKSAKKKYNKQHGRQLHEDANKKKRRMTTAEENALIDQAFQLKHWGFPPRVYIFIDIGTHIYRQRVPDGTLSRKWLQGFYERHPTVKSRYSQPIHYVRSVQGNNLEAISEFFQTVSSYLYFPIFHFKN